MISHGIDITQVERIRRLTLEEAFVKRVFTDLEAGHAKSKRDPAIRFAVLFAAKEAVMKALGTGWSKDVGWKDIEIIEGKNKRQDVRLYNGAERVLAGRTIYLSVSCAKDYAVAAAIIE